MQRQEIQITMPDASIRSGEAWTTTPMEIATQISKSLADRTVIAKVDGQLWDLNRPFEKSCKLELLDFDTDEGKSAFV